MHTSWLAKLNNRKQLIAENNAHTLSNCQQTVLSYSGRYRFKALGERLRGWENGVGKFQW